MTRINLVLPSELTDQHLIAEYRETRLLVANTRRSFAAGANDHKIPTTFTLNAGHCLFFKNKGLYINKRYHQLMAEMIDRGFQPQHSNLDTSVWPPGYFNDWEPSESDKNVVRARIALRISQRPNWYRYRGQPYTTQGLLCT